MATAAAPPPRQGNPRSLSLDGLVTIVGAVTLMLTIIFFNQNLGNNINLVRTELKADIDRLEVDIGTVRTELKADIEAVRSELKADIEAVRSELKADIDAVRSELQAVRVELSADIQRVDDRLFAIAGSPDDLQTEDSP